VLFAAYFALALAFRAFLLGNPVYHIDEGFYLYVAHRWNEGALPYIDVWDRKPIGLFLLYRIFLLAPGNGVAGYQIAAIVSTAVTAVVIERLARHIANERGALAAGAAYVLYMPVFNCALGQSPVFYNLPVSLAALVLVTAWKRQQSADLAARGALAMALIGLAIQIKSSVVFEGFAFGLMLLARGWADVWPWRKLFAAALLWVGVAILPSLIAFSAYALGGHAETFIHANFVSVFRRGTEGPITFWRLGKEFLLLTPFWLAIFRAPRCIAWAAGSDRRVLGVLRVWATFAIAGFLAFGTWYDHYVGPLLPALAVLAAPALGRTVPGERWYGRVLLGFGAIASVVVMVSGVMLHGNAAQVQRMAALVGAELHGGCYFQFDGEPALYRVVGACLPTRFAYPNHLNTWTEALAMDVDVNREVTRIMQSRPDVVQIGEWTNIYLPNWQTRAIAQRFLARDYEQYGRATLGVYTYGLYRLKKLPDRDSDKLNQPIPGGLICDPAALPNTRNSQRAPPPSSGQARASSARGSAG